MVLDLSLRNILTQPAKSLVKFRKTKTLLKSNKKPEKDTSSTVRNLILYQIFHIL